MSNFVRNLEVLIYSFRSSASSKEELLIELRLLSGLITVLRSNYESGKRRRGTHLPASDFLSTEQYLRLRRHLDTLSGQIYIQLMTKEDYFDRK